jgi:2-haloacid dehalogenase
MPDLPTALVFDTFGTLVDWRGSLIAALTAFGDARAIRADWPRLVDAWRGEYMPSMDRVRRGTQPWTDLDGLHRASLEKLVAAQGIAGLSAADLDQLTLGWHRLTPWPDVVAGLTRMKAAFIIGPLSNGNVRLLIDLAKYGGLPWDMIFGADLFRHYKPDPETYLGVANLLGVVPGQVMMVAAHNGDLAAAQACGLRTAFIPRPTEYGPDQSRDLRPTGAWDHVADSVEALATLLGA